MWPAPSAFGRVSLRRPHDRHDSCSNFATCREPARDASTRPQRLAPCPLLPPLPAAAPAPGPPSPAAFFVVASSPPPSMRRARDAEKVWTGRRSLP